MLHRATAQGLRVVAAASDGAEAAAHVQLFGSRIVVPPLSARRADIPDLVAGLLTELAGGDKRVVNPAAMQALLRHDWPGNVLELRAALSVAAAGSSEIGTFDLPEDIRDGDGPDRWTPLELAERNAILQALLEHEGNKATAAEALGLARSTLYRKLRALQIDVARHRMWRNRTLTSRRQLREVDPRSRLGVPGADPPSPWACRLRPEPHPTS